MIRKRPKEVPKRKIEVFRRPDSLVEVHIGDERSLRQRQNLFDLTGATALYDDEFQELKSKINSVKPITEIKIEKEREER